MRSYIEGKLSICRDCTRTLIGKQLQIYEFYSYKAYNLLQQCFYLKIHICSSLQK